MKNLSILLINLFIFTVISLLYPLDRKKDNEFPVIDKKFTGKDIILSEEKSILWEKYGYRGFHAYDPATDKKGHCIIDFNTAFLMDHREKIFVLDLINQYALYDFNLDKIIFYSPFIKGNIYKFGDKLLIEEYDENNKSKWALLDIYVSERTENDLTKYMRKVKFGIQGESNAINYNKRIILGTIQTGKNRYNTDDVILKWDHEFKNPKIIKLKNEKWINKLRHDNILFSPDGNWLATFLYHDKFDEDNIDDEDYKELVIFHVDQDYEICLSKPVSGGKFLYGASYEFAKHKNYGDILLVNYNGKVLIYRLDYVKNQLSIDDAKFNNANNENKHKDIFLRNNELHEAIIHHENDKALNLIKDKSLISKHGYFYKTPLSLAVEYNNTEIMKTLIRNGADVNQKAEYGLTPLHIAIYKSNREIVDFLLDNGADINAGLFTGLTPIFFAVENSNVELVNLLIKKGADLNINLNDESNLIFYAIEKENPEILRVLLINNINCNVKNKDKNTPLLDLINKKYSNDLIKLMLEKGACVNSCGQYNYSPLYKAVCYNKIELVKLLLDYGADINQKSYDNETALHKACDEGYLDIVNLLIKNCADINIRNNVDWTPLHEALREKHSDIAKILINNNADLNVKIMHHGDTPLHLAVYGKEIVKLLIDKGADINVQDSCGNTLLFDAIFCNNIDVIEILLQSGARVDFPNKNGIYPLHPACRKNIETVKILIEYNADVNVKSDNDETPLHEACSEGNIEIIKYLIDKGAHVNAQNKNQIAPIHRAIDKECIEAVRVLIENIADVNLKEYWDLTPLHIAAYKNSFRLNNCSYYLIKFLRAVSKVFEITPYFFFT